MSDVFQWTTTHGHTGASRPAKTYIHQLCVDTRCCQEDMPGVMADRDPWKEKVKGNPCCGNALMNIIMIKIYFVGLASILLLFFNIMAILLD